MSSDRAITCFLLRAVLWCHRVTERKRRKKIHMRERNTYICESSTRFKDFDFLNCILRDSIRHPRLAVKIAQATPIPREGERERDTRKRKKKNKENICIVYPYSIHFHYTYIPLFCTSHYLHTDEKFVQNVWFKPLNMENE